MTLTELKNQILYRLGETTSPQFWSATEIALYINEAYKNIATYSNIMYTSAQISLVEDQYLYDAASDCISILRMFYDTSEKIIEPTTFIAINKMDPYWEETRANYPTHYCFIPPDQIFLYPMVSAAEASCITYYYSNLPDDISTTVPRDLPEPFHRAIIEYAVAIGLMRKQTTADQQKSMIAYQKFLELRNKADSRSNDRDDRTIQIRKRFE